MVPFTVNNLLAEFLLRGIFTFSFANLEHLVIKKMCFCQKQNDGFTELEKEIITCHFEFFNTLIQ